LGKNQIAATHRPMVKERTGCKARICFWLVQEKLPIDK
jgi:hypothetical protein